MPCSLLLQATACTLTQLEVHGALRPGSLSPTERARLRLRWYLHATGRKRRTGLALLREALPALRADA